jgi:hypothetical protein
MPNPIMSSNVHKIAKCSLPTESQEIGDCTNLVGMSAWNSPVPMNSGKQIPCFSARSPAFRVFRGQKFAFR